jgi:hypothetical protein
VSSAAGTFVDIGFFVESCLNTQSGSNRP